MEGRITAVDAGRSTFELRGLTVSYANSRIVGGTPAQLVVGAKIEVEGGLSAEGNVVVAALVEFD